MFRISRVAAWIGSQALALALGLTAPAIGAAQEVSPEWQKIINAAKAEGTVTIYSGQGLKQLNDLATRFKAKYGINVQVVRAVESDLFPKVDVEFQTGRGIADILVNSSITTLLEQEKKGYMVPAAGPAFDNPDYKRAERMPKNTYFETNATVLTFSWNTDLYPKGLKDYDSVFDPALKGKLGVPMAKAQGQVDYYLYLTENYGQDYVERLAEMKPRAYPGALPLAQAVASGEVAATIYGEPLIDEKEAGAPVGWGLAPKPWGARFYGMVLKTAPHPNAAQLLANFMVTPEGQEAIARKAASALPNIKGAIATTDTVRKLDPAKLTPEYTKAFGEKWDRLFIGN
jgi:iron(III) transport system substrate-binding protein